MADTGRHTINYYGRWLHRTAVALFTLICITIFLIAIGLFDPIPPEINSVKIPPITLSVDPESQTIIWQTNLPSPPYLINLTANLQSGEVDSGYGLLLGTNNAYFAVAVAPTGYLSVWQTGAQATTFLPWQTWPHIQTGNNANEIGVEVAADGFVTVRINGEYLWSGAIEMPLEAVGIYGESFGKTAVIHFQE
ncbi:MAG: hypothetical protein KDE48_18150 [Anaerolineales bacterium]|nr:hypothetical protein [Anaerolineales bacterium]